MLIIAGLYTAAVWLVFSRLKLVQFGWTSGSLAVLGGFLILAVFLAMFNYLTPSGQLTVIGRVVEVTPNVSGQIISIPVKPNVPVKAGEILFQIDPAPFKTTVDQLEASLEQAKQQAKQLVSNYAQASANVEGLTAQLAYNRQRLSDMSKLTGEEAQSLFKMQDAQVQYETVQYQLQAAKSAQEAARLAMNSQIGGVNTTVAQTQAQLANARWQLDQTTVRAPADGVVTLMALAIGDRALQSRSALSFIVTDDIALVGMFPPNGFQTIRPGAPVKVILDTHPGQIFDASVVQITRGIGEGQVAVSGTLGRPRSVGGTSVYPVEISIPDQIEKSSLRIGMPGKATVFSERAGVIGLIMSVIFWFEAYTAYL